MASEAQGPHRAAIYEELRSFCTYGARLHWIRKHAPTVLGLRCVEAKATELRARKDEPGSPLEVPDSDGAAEAVVAVLLDCIRPIRHTEEGRLLRIVMDLDSRYRGTSASERRAIAGREFRGVDGSAITAGTIRQRHERHAVALLAGLLLAHEGSA